jgi:hypothetical protein
MGRVLRFYIIIIIFSVFFQLLHNTNYYNYSLNREEKITQLEDPPFGILEIYNVTIEKDNMIIGDSLIINGSYKLFLAEGWRIDHIYFGIKNSFEYLGISLPRNEGGYVFVSHKFFFDPEDINRSTDYKGFLEIYLEEIQNPGNVVVKIKESIYSLDFNKSDISHKILYQYPELIFSQDDLNISLELSNAFNESFKYRNKLITFNLSNPARETHISQTAYTDNNGIVNIMLNTSSIGSGYYTIFIYADQTANYMSWCVYLTGNIYDESSNFNISILNSDHIYTNIGLNDSYSEIKLRIFCTFNSTIIWNSNFGSGSLKRNNCNQYFRIMRSPMGYGEYIINSTAIPDLAARNLTLTRTISVKKRESLINMTIDKSTDSDNSIKFYLSLLDLLTSTKVVNQSLNLYYFNFLDNNWTFIDEIELINLITEYRWLIPPNYNRSKLKFKVDLVNNSLFEYSKTFREILVPIICSNLKNSYPLSTKVNIVINLKYLNGTNIINEYISIWIDNQTWILKTDEDGLINITYLTPSKKSSIFIIINYSGNSSILSANLKLNILIKRDILQTFSYYSGYIIALSILLFSTVILLKKLVVPKKLNNIKIK